MKSASSLSNVFKESLSTAVSAAVETSDHSEDDRHPTAVLEHELEHEREQGGTPITTGSNTTTTVAVKEAEGGKGDGDGDDDETRTKNGDLVTEEMVADVEADVTIDEANSLLKSPPVVAGGSVNEDDDTERAK
jgi:hypothetical protein